MKIKDVIKKLQELDEKDYTICVNVEPKVNRMECWGGDDIETTRYIYTITLAGKEKSRKYKRKNGIIKYLGSDK